MEERHKIVALNKQMLQIFASRLREHVRKTLVDTTKELNQLGQQFRDSVLELPVSEHKPSESAKKAAEFISTTNEIEFIEKDDHHPDVKWLMGLLLLLIGKRDTVALNDPETTWKKSKPFLQEAVVTGGIEGLFTNPTKGLNLSPENAFRMKKYINGDIDKLESTHYEKMNPIAGFLAAFIKDALKSAGVIEPTPQHKYQETQYIFDCYSDYSDRIASFAKKMKLAL